MSQRIQVNALPAVACVKLVHTLVSLMHFPRHSSVLFIAGADHVLLYVPQGLQVLVDADSAFGGVASSALTHAADDYPRLPIILFALQHSAAAPARLPSQDQASDLALIHRITRC